MILDIVMGILICLYFVGVWLGYQLFSSIAKNKGEVWGLTLIWPVIVIVAMITNGWSKLWKEN